jgi:uncharacterized protein YfaQ (DUF2300 family)
MRVASLLGILLVLGSCLSAAAQTEGAPSFLDALEKASPETQAAVSKLLTDKYPTLPGEIATLILRERASFFTDVRPLLDKLVAEKYPGLRAFVEEQLRKAPTMQAAIDQLIAQRYPDLVAEIRALPPGPDLSQRAAALVQTKYPDLLRDVLVVLQTQHPDLITQIQSRVREEFPGFIADAGTLVLTRYPELTGKIVAIVTAKYPQLLPELLKLLMAPAPPAPAPKPAEPTPPPAG